MKFTQTKCAKELPGQYILSIWETFQTTYQTFVEDASKTSRVSSLGQFLVSMISWHCRLIWTKMKLCLPLSFKFWWFLCCGSGVALFITIHHSPLQWWAVIVMIMSLSARFAKQLVFLVAPWSTSRVEASRWKLQGGLIKVVMMEMVEMAMVLIMVFITHV